MDTLFSRVAAKATDEEHAILCQILHRLAAPACVVTVRHGGTARRYVVDRDDEWMFDGLDHKRAVTIRPTFHWTDVFGGRRLRRLGVVDPERMILHGVDVINVTFPDADLVFGQRSIETEYDKMGFICSPAGARLARKRRNQPRNILTARSARGGELGDGPHTRTAA